MPDGEPTKCPTCHPTPPRPAREPSRPDPRCPTALRRLEIAGAPGPDRRPRPPARTRGRPAGARLVDGGTPGRRRGTPAAERRAPRSRAEVEAERGAIATCSTWPPTPTSSPSLQGVDPRGQPRGLGDPEHRHQFLVGKPLVVFLPEAGRPAFRSEMARLRDVARRPGSTTPAQAPAAPGDRRLDPGRRRPRPLGPGRRPPLDHPRRLGPEAGRGEDPRPQRPARTPGGRAVRTARFGLAPDQRAMADPGPRRRRLGPVEAGEFLPGPRRGGRRDPLAGRRRDRALHLRQPEGRGAAGLHPPPRWIDDPDFWARAASTPRTATGPPPTAGSSSARGSITRPSTGSSPPTAGPSGFARPSAAPRMSPTGRRSSAA